MKNWTDIGSDLNWADYGGRWARRAGDPNDLIWFVIEFTNMDDALGPDNEGHDKYLAEVQMVDFREIDADTLAIALDSCDVDPDASEIEIVAACAFCGCYAPLGSHSGNSYPDRVRAAARREAESLMRDAAALDSALDKPVNRIGSTAREYARGDIASAILRGLAEGSPEADLLARMGMLRGRGR